MNMFAEMAKGLLASSDLEVAAAKTDICAFAEYVMRDPQGRPIKLQDFHRAMLQALTSDRFILIKAFRGSGKSVLISVCYPLWLIMKNRDVRIMLVTAADPLAKQWLRNIEQYMNTPQYMKLVGGSLIPQPGEGLMWTSEEKMVRGRTNTGTGATLLALGVHGQIRGRRVDHAICDDLINESNSHTQYQREVLSHWFHSAVIPTLDHDPADVLSGQCVVVGTPLYDADLMSTLKAEWGPKEEVEEQSSDA